MDDLGHILWNSAPVLENIYLVISVLKNLFSLIIFVLLLSNLFIFIFILFYWYSLLASYLTFCTSSSKEPNGKFENEKMDKCMPGKCAPKEMWGSNLESKNNEVNCNNGHKICYHMPVKKQQQQQQQQVPWRGDLVIEGSLRDLFNCKMELPLKMC